MGRVGDTSSILNDDEEALNGVGESGARGLGLGVKGNRGRKSNFLGVKFAKTGMSVEALRLCKFADWRVRAETIVVSSCHCRDETSMKGKWAILTSILVFGATRAMGIKYLSSDIIVNLWSR